MTNQPKTQPAKPANEQLLNNLRAQSWSDFRGQDQIKQSLQIAIKAAKERGEALDHVLLYGPPGVGKTTLAHLIAKEMGVSLRITSGTALTKVGDLAAILTNLEPKEVLFVDEIHRLPKAVEETLYPVMEDFALDIVIGKGPSARTLRLDLPKFTLVGATTRYGLLTGPFRDRFGMIHRLKQYNAKALSEIIEQAAKQLKLKLDSEAAKFLASRSRGTPRIGLKLLKRIRDFAQVEQHQQIDRSSVEAALALYQIDEYGLDELDRNLLLQLIEKHQGGPVGLTTIAATLHEDVRTIEEVLEPYLLQIGLLKRTPQGRVVTITAYRHLGKKHPTT